MSPAPQPYERLTPDLVVDAVESLDLYCDGRILTLNSYENRVYRVGIEDAPPLVAKFYRPGRWSDAQILEEHAFAAELMAAEIPVIGPLQLTSQLAAGPSQGELAPSGGQRPTLRWSVGAIFGAQFGDEKRSDPALR